MAGSYLRAELLEGAAMDLSHKIRVLVVDDHPLMVAGIKGEIDAQPDMTVLAQAADGEEALSLYRTYRPDVTIMDVRMPKLNGIDAIVAIREEFPKARIIVLTTAIGDVQAFRALKEGAMGYLLKNLVRKELTETIRAVHAVSSEFRLTLHNSLPSTSRGSPSLPENSTSCGRSRKAKETKSSPQILRSRSIPLRIT
jgi:DNA-binding NarL/FixJ family response regulator